MLKAAKKPGECIAKNCNAKAEYIGEWIGKFSGLYRLMKKYFCPNCNFYFSVAGQVMPKPLVIKNADAKI